MRMSPQGSIVQGPHLAYRGGGCATNLGRTPVFMARDAGINDSSPASFPKALFLLAWPPLFFLYNDLTSPSRPFEEQVASDIADAAKSGNLLNRVLVVLLASVGTFLLLKYWRRFRPQPLLLTVFLGFLGWITASAAWSSDPGLSVRRVTSLLLLVVFSLGCTARMDASVLSLFFGLMPVAGIVPGILSEVHYGAFRPFGYDYRFEGAAPHPNVQGVMLAFSCILLSGVFSCSSGRRKTVAGCLAAVAFGFLMLTASRTSILSTILVLVLSKSVDLISRHRRHLRVILALFIFMLSSLILVNLLVSAQQGRPAYQSLLKSEHDEQDPTSFNGRLYLWQTCLHYALQRPVLGYGFGAFWSPDRIESVSEDQGWAIQQSHCAYIDELLAIGFPGLALYLACLAVALYSSIRYSIKGHLIFASWAWLVVFIIIHDCTESVNVSSHFTFLFFCVLQLSLALSPPPANPQPSILRLEAASSGLRAETQLF